MTKIQIFSFIFVFLLLNACQKGENIAADFYDCHLSFADSSANNPKNERYQALLDSLTAEGVVGMSMAIYQPKTGIWLGASGKADLHNDIDMKPCNISRVGSTVKMFTAVAILKLMEEGKLNLDDKISLYLGTEVLGKIENADKATIRQLLQHSSGIYNYIQNLSFQTASINDLIREWNAEDLLQYTHHQKAYFAPSEDVRYSNTGYILLGLLIEKVAGKPFYKVFEEKIFSPLGMNATRFAAENPVPNGIIRGYVDFYSDLQVIESTYFSGWDYYTADGGLISTPYELNIFMQALMNGEILQPSSLNEMLNCKAPKEMPTDFFPISYGLGIFKIETPKGIAYIHSGDAIGYYAHIMYFPSDSSTIVYATNSNYGKIDQHISSQKAMENIINVAK